MSVHPALDRLLASMPWLSVVRAPISQQARYYPEHQAILVRHGLRGGRYMASVAHEAIHAKRGDVPCLDPVAQSKQEASCEQETARLLVDLDALASAAAAYPEDPHRVAEELDVDYDILTTRVQHLHPSERHYLRRRLAHLEESA